MKILVAVALLALCALGFWFFDWRGKGEELAAVRAARAESEARLASTRELVADLPRLVAQKERLQAQLPRGGATRHFVARFVGDLERVVEEERRRSGDASFRILSITPGAEVAAGDEEPLPSRGFQLALQGRYDTVVGFLHRLGALGLGGPVTLNRLTLAPTDAGGAGPPVLAVSLPVTAWLTGP